MQGMFIMFISFNSIITRKHIIHDVSHVMRKSVFGVSDQVRYKLGCTATVNSDLGRRGIVLSM